MQNFIFKNPTKIIFGEGTIPQLGAEAIHFGKKALLVYGKSSIKNNGVFGQVADSLKNSGIEFIEFSGVKSNPVLSHTREGVELAKREVVDMVIAVGGGSVLDESKAIAAGAVVEHDVWGFFTRDRKIESALPLLTVLTLAATGSEMNGGAVITNEETAQKFSMGSPFTYPKVSILDPVTTCSVPKDYTAYGAADATAHLIEGYFTQLDPWTPIQDRFVEGLQKSIRESAARILENPNDYQGRATMMWAATLALNGIVPAGIGKIEFPNHMIEHSLSALYDVAHGAGLAIVIPAWMKYTARTKPEKFAQFAERVFDVQPKSDVHETANAGTEALKEWFSSIGCPVTLAEAGIPAGDIPKIAENAYMLAEKWGISHYTKQVIEEILELCK